MDRSDPPYGWVLVAVLGTTETVSWGVLYYAFAVFLIPMRAELGLPATEIAGAFSLALAISGLTGMFVGRWLDSHGPRALMTVGSTLSVLLVMAWSRVRSLVELYAVFAGIGVAMAMVLYEPAFIAITKWFAVRRHRALTTLTLMAALASFIFSPLSEHLIATLGWRHALLVLALILAAVTIPLHALGLRSPPAGSGPAVGARFEKAAGQETGSLPGIWLLITAFVLLNLVSSALSALLVTFLVSGGQTAAFAAGIAGLVGVSQIPGRVFFAVVTPWVRGWSLPVAVFGLGSLAVALLALDRSAPALVAFAVVYGMSNGMATLMRAALVADLYGQASYGRVSSTVAAFVSGARAVAPFAAACAALLPGGFGTLLWIFTAASAAAPLTAGRAVMQATAERPRQSRTADV